MANELGYLYALIFLLGGAAVAGGAFMGMLILPPKKRTAEKAMTYESGETPIGSAWVQYPLAFYIFALLFVAFDVDIIFIISWATVFQQLGWFGYIEIVFFIVTLAIGIAYAWRKGVIKWI